MKNINETFIRKIRNLLFAARLERAMHRKPSRDSVGKNQENELYRLYVRNSLQFRHNLDRIKAEAEKMRNDEAKAFQCIIYQDLNARLDMFLEFAEKRAHGEKFEIVSVASPA